MNQLALDDKMMSPTHDLVFKSLFTRDCKESKIILKDLISSVIGVEVDKVEIKENELAKNDVNEKQERLDVNCTVNGGELVNIEMYSEVKDGHLTSNNYRGLINKSLYYATRLFSSQNMKGKYYDEVAKTIQITFTSNRVFKGSGHFVNEFVFTDRISCETLTESLIIIFIELPKLKDTIKKPVNEMTSLEKWGIFLEHANDRDYRELLNQIIESKEEISMASELLQSISEDPHMQAKLLTIDKNETDRESFKMYEIARGKKEKALESAKVMVKDNMPEELISKYAGISSDEVDFLISRHAAHTLDQVKVFDLKFV